MLRLAEIFVFLVLAVVSLMGAIIAPGSSLLGWCLLNVCAFVAFASAYRIWKELFS